MKNATPVVNHAFASPTFRTETFDGREHLVVPVVALVEGVVNGILASSEEILASTPAWNGVPVTLNHPTKRGVPVSANDPEILTSKSLGRLFNATFDGEKLRGELWIDSGKTSQIAPQVLERINAGEPLEVSTGYFAGVITQSGSFNGGTYTGIYKTIRPNHLALLPDEQGACSWAMGCGTPRVNQSLEGGKTVLQSFRQNFSHLASALGFVVNELSHDAQRRALYDALNALEPSFASDGYIEDIFEKYFIYSIGGKLYQRDYAVASNDAISIGTDKTEVIRKREYAPAQPAPVANNATIEKDGTMSAKTPIINQLIACQKCPFVEEDRASLELLEVEALTRIQANAQAVQPATEAPEGFALVTNEDKALLDARKAELTAERTAMVEKVIANHANLTAEQVNALPVEVLTALAAETASETADFSGRGGAAPVVVNSSKVPEMPAVFLAKESK